MIAGRAQGIIEKAKNESGNTLVYGQGEQKLEVFERSAFLPFVRFKKEMNHEDVSSLGKDSKYQDTPIALTLSSFGYFKSTYNVHVPSIYTQLGIHEPVYGRLARKDPNRMIERINRAIKLYSEKVVPQITSTAAQTEPESQATPPTPSESKLIDILNSEREITYPITLTRDKFTRNRLRNNLFDALNEGKSLDPIKQDYQLEVFERVKKVLDKKASQEESQIQKKAEKKKVNVEDMKRDMEEARKKWRSREGRMPGITTFTAVAIVKNKKGDIASVTQ
jgi:hypothetical protein